MEAKYLGKSERSFSNAFLWIKADDPNHKTQGRKETVLIKKVGDELTTIFRDKGSGPG